MVCHVGHGIRRGAHIIWYVVVLFVAYGMGTDVVVGMVADHRLSGWPGSVVYQGSSCLLGFDTTKGNGLARGGSLRRGARGKIGRCSRVALAPAKNAFNN